MYSSDSSDDEKLGKLREAACTQFLNDTMFNGTSSESDESKKSNKSETQLPPSLRINTIMDDFNNLNVTPQFQKHVAKQLTGLLDLKLAKVLSSKHSTDVLRKRKKGGVRLFSNSNNVIKFNKHKVVKQKRCYKYSDESDNETKCIESAVSPDDILSKKEVANWSNRSKGKIFKYTYSEDGSLVSIE